MLIDSKGDTAANYGKEERKMTQIHVAPLTGEQLREGTNRESSREISVDDNEPLHAV